MVTNSPLGSWLEEVVVAGGTQWRAWWNVSDQHEQVGDVRRLTSQGLPCARGDTVCTRFIARQEATVTPEGLELHGRVVSGRARVSPPSAGLSAVVPMSPPGGRRGRRYSTRGVTAHRLIPVDFCGFFEWRLIVANKISAKRDITAVTTAACCGMMLVSCVTHCVLVGWFSVCN